MNPYASPSHSLSDAGLLPVEPLTRRDRTVALFVVALLSASVGMFVFFGLIELVGLGVNWPNVLPLLGLDFIAMITLALFLRPFLRRGIRMWSTVRYTVTGGILLGSTGAALAYLRVI
ncbi:hypothetical protein CA13_09280 [Planctomycetes bacterium CA13]|uniref:Uncharacterized protein n=1 Tax=Novipirellula herctigrandis TaxID=2527986 RepID=A0A5C5YWV9_9BACT|nr:hypothetical protein CA13_09280 [Planctomycetes bacterium CA13]